MVLKRIENETNEENESILASIKCDICSLWPWPSAHSINYDIIEIGYCHCRSISPIIKVNFGINYFSISVIYGRYAVWRCELLFLHIPCLISAQHMFWWAFDACNVSCVSIMYKSIFQLNRMNGIFQKEPMVIAILLGHLKVKRIKNTGLFVFFSIVSRHYIT